MHGDGMLLSSQEIHNLTGEMERLFITMSSGRNSYVTIIKAPIEVINDSTQDVMAGYGPENMDKTTITYIPKTGVYPCVTVYPYKNMPKDSFTQLKFVLDLNSVVIKVKENCRTFIHDGKNQNVIIDNLLYTIQKDEQIQNYWGSKYYYFKCNMVQ